LSAATKGKRYKQQKYETDLLSRFHLGAKVVFRANNSKRIEKIALI
jgi:hypothetical protein